MSNKKDKFRDLTPLWLLYPLIILYLTICSCTLLEREVQPEAEALQELSLLPAWQYDTNGRIRRIAGLADDKLILYTYETRFIALDIVSGTISWSYEPPGPITDLVSRNELLLKDELLVFTSFIDNRGHSELIVLDAKTGQKLWGRDDRKGGRVASTFAVGDKYIYWALWPYYYAFDRYTGEVIWQSELETGPGGYSGLLYDKDNDELVIVRPDMYVLDASTGKTKRSLDFKINSTGYKIDNGIIYFIFGEIRAMDTKNNSILWNKRPISVDGSSIKWTPLLRDEKLYLGLNGSIGVLDTRTGETIWGKSEFDKNEAIVSSNPVFVGNTIYAVFSDGSLRMFSDIDGAEMGQVEFGTAWEDAALYATDEMLFVSLGTERLYAYTILN